METKQIETYYSDADAVDFSYLSILTEKQLKVYFEKLFQNLGVDLCGSELFVKLLPTDSEDEYLDLDNSKNINFVQLYSTKGHVQNYVNLRDLINIFSLDFPEIVRGEGGSCFEDHYKIDMDALPPGEGYEKILEIDMKTLEDNEIVIYGWMPT